MLMVSSGSERVRSKLVHKWNKLVHYWFSWKNQLFLLVFAYWNNVTYHTSLQDIEFKGLNRLTGTIPTPLIEL